MSGELLEAIQASLIKLGKTVDSVTIEDLAPVDEFHIGGRLVCSNRAWYSTRFRRLDPVLFQGLLCRYLHRGDNNCSYQAHAPYV